MTYAYVQDVAASWERYKQVAAALGDSLPSGLLMHLAGPTDEGVRIIGVWESQEAWERFCGERLAQAVAAFGGPARPEVTFRDVRPEHVVVGNTTAS